MTSQLEAQQFSTASYIADNIESQVKLRINALKSIADSITPELIANPGRLRDFLHVRFLFASLFETGIEVISREGIGISDFPVLSGRAGGLHADLDFVREVVATGKPAVGKPRIGRFSKKAVIPFAVPVLNSSGRIVAVLAGYPSVSDPTLLGSIEKSEHKDFPDGLLVGSRKYNMFITGSDPSRVLEPRPAPGVNPLLDRMEAGFEGSGITVNSRGVRILVSCKQIPASGWFIRVGLPTKIAFAPIRSMKRWAYSIAFGLSLLSSFFVWLIIRQAMRPIAVASKLITDMTEERVPQRDIPVTQYDEVGQLLTSFNVHLNYRKQAEEALRQSREQLDLALISSRMAVFEWDIVRNKRIWSDGVHRLLGTKPESFTGTADDFFRVIHPEDRSTVKDALDRAVETGQYETEYRAVWPDGNIHHMAARGKIHHDNTGQAIQMTGVCWDVTGGKQVEEELRSATQRLKLATQSGKLGVWDWDITNNIMVWDERMFELYGLTPETFPGCIEALQNCLHPEDRDKTIEECRVALRSEKGWDTEFRILHPDGTVRVIKVNALVIRDADGNPVRMIGLNRDFTEFRKMTLELNKSNEQLRNLAAHLQSVREEERTKIAREIHDELGQTLAAQKMELSWFCEQYGDHKPIVDKSEAMLEALNATIRSVRRICTELRPSILDDFGLVDAMRWYADEFQKRTRIECTVDSVPEDIELDKDWSTALFRIFQETLTNVLKHARATKVTARLTKDDVKITLEVTDNGKGIRDEQFSKPQSFGLIGIRERVHIWGGKAEVTGYKNKGTMVKVSMPHLV